MDGNANIFPTTAEAIMRDRKFQAGFADARAGGGPGGIWAYERLALRPPLSARAPAIRQGHGPRGHLMSERFDNRAPGPKRSAAAANIIVPIVANQISPAAVVVAVWDLGGTPAAGAVTDTRGNTYTRSAVHQLRPAMVRLGAMKSQQPP